MHTHKFILKRGEIWLVNFAPLDKTPPKGHEQDGTRPAVVVSSTFVDTSKLDQAVVVPGTKKGRINQSGKLVPNHLQVAPSPENGLDLTTYFMSEQIRSVAVSPRFKHKIGVLSEADLYELEDILIMLLDLGPKD